MDYRIKLANRIIGISSLHDEVYNLCKDYLTEENEDFHVFVTQADIDFERNKSIQESLLEGLVPCDYPDSYLETLAVYRKIATTITAYDTWLMHGAVVGVDGEAVLFTAKSGVGKTTHIGLWLKQIPGAFVVNGDKPLIRRTESGFEAYGTPWAGKEGMQKNTSLPLKVICFIERGEVNEIERVDFSEFYPMLIQQSFRPADPEGMVKTMGFIKALGGNVPLYRLRCNMEDEAAKVAYEGIYGRKA